MTKRTFLLLSLITLIACTKDSNNDHMVSNSIYGEYYDQGPQTGSPWDFLGGISIDVSPGSATHIQVIIYKIYDTVIFNSAKLGVDNSFTVDEIIKDRSSSSGYSHATGNGTFPTKAITYNVFIDRQGPIGDESEIAINAKKVRD